MNTSLRLKFGGLIALVVCWCILMVYLVSSLEWMPPLPLLQQFQNTAPKNAPSYEMLEMNPILHPKLMKYMKDLSPTSLAMKPVKSKPTVASARATAVEPPDDSTVQVVMGSDTANLGGLVAAINSILSNTKRPVKFYIVITEEELPHLKTWIHSTKLHTMHYETHSLALSGSKATTKLRKTKAEIGLLFPTLEGRVIYLDSDVIVQGDIWELFSVVIRPGTYGAFAQDCSSSSARTGGTMGRPRYATYINLHHSHLKKANIDGATCPFATGVFVANISIWRARGVFKKLQDWLDIHIEDPITGIHPGVNGLEAAMLIEFYGQVSPLDPLWHVQHLGIGSGTRHSKQFMEHAKLLHWNGHFKPWRHWSAHAQHWDRYFIPDPTLQFRPVRKRG